MFISNVIVNSLNLVTLLLLSIYACPILARS